ncbi:hypothetical protein FOS14_12285 [Skermania sp. ID1734]|nr:hypothetical protein FOS14_12285 [Skermania sp. ID1734]
MPAIASADTDPNDPYGFNAVRDRTDYFVAPLAPGALFGDKATSPIIISPFGTSQKIECRGDGHYVQIHDCVQYDLAGNPHNLAPVGMFFRTVYFYS